MINITYIEWLYAIPVSLALLILLLSITFAQRKVQLDNEQRQVRKLFQRIYYFPAIKLLFKPEKSASDKKYTAHLYSYIKYGVFIIFLHIALSQPYKTGERIPDPPLHRDIVFLVDTSISLVLRDYIINGQRTDRMTMLKIVLNHFIDKLQGNRISLIIFSEQAYTYVPLTTDYALLRFQLDRLQPAVLTGRTTDVSRGLLYALQQLKKSSQPDQERTDNNKPVLVLISDVNRPNRDIDPRVVAKLLAQQSIRLHAIALGAATDAANEKATTGLVYQPANFKLIQEVAEAANGKFFWANNTENLQAALDTIQSSEKKHIKVEPVFIRHTLYPLPLAAALLWIAMSSLVPLLRRQY